MFDSCLYVRFLAICTILGTSSAPFALRRPLPRFFLAMGDMLETTTWVPVPDRVTIEDVYKKAGFTRTTFTGKGPEVHTVLCLGEKDSFKYDYYDIADCEPYDDRGRMIVRFGNLSRDDFYFVKRESGTYYKYELTIQGKKMHFIVSHSDYLNLVPEDREYLESLPNVCI